MSRVGKLPIQIPSGVTITVDSDAIKVSGAKGNLETPQLEGITVKVEDGVLTVTRANDEPKIRAKHGLIRALINNMVVGVSQGFSKQLELNGVGFRVALVGTDLKFNIGFSHEVVYKLPQGVTATVEQNKITVSGVDKQQVGQVAAEIRALKKPEPYKGKGIKYIDERILRKSGKSGKDK
ncbi:MAG: large subunit ribosomal protein [Patescibacteria group bacterium]|nr:50S ribosomal protein L6 [Candidatus Saccharibacteria bacterium]MDQ5963444.1 large subunit ribosomal protein [Patescibacteria group bacterium]